MKTCSFILLFMLMACTHSPERTVASQPVLTMGEVSEKFSKVKLYDNEATQAQPPRFYLELRDARGRRIDVELKDINVRHGQNQLDSRARRLGRGRYEVEVSLELAQADSIKFFVQDTILNYKLVLTRKPIRSQSKLELLSQDDHTLKLRLTLRDKKSLPIEVQEPDIILEGLGEISDIQQVKNGVWEFYLSFPEFNQLLYLSVRANGVLLERIFRFQHVEK